jgi:nicotinamide mononucleotide transporter
MWVYILDLTGAFFAFLATIFFIRLNIIAWPISLIACSIDITLYFKQGIYADALLTGIYFLFMLYGWYKWRYGDNKDDSLPITNLTPALTFKLGIIAVVAILGIYILLQIYTDSEIPFWDATTAVLSLTAQWLTCRKIIQNWLLWILVDGLYTGIYFYKGIPLHAILQIIYLCMAAIGYLRWQKQIGKGVRHRCLTPLPEFLKRAS